MLSLRSILRVADIQPRRSVPVQSSAAVPAAVAGASRPRSEGRMPALRKSASAALALALVPLRAGSFGTEGSQSDSESDKWLKKPNLLPRVGLLGVLQHSHNGIRAGIEHHGSALPRS